MSDPAATPVPDWAREMVGGADYGAPTLGNCPRTALAVWAGTRPPKKARRAPGEAELFLYQARLALAILEALESPSGRARASTYHEQARAEALRLGLELAPPIGAEHLGGRTPDTDRPQRSGWSSPGW